TVAITDNSTTSDYHALQMKFERRLSRGLQAIGSYTWSHSIDSASTDAFANYLNTPGSFANPNIDRGNSDFDIRHAFSAGVPYELPSPPPALRVVLGGWSVDAFTFARSSPPDNVIGAIFRGAGIAVYQRPNLVPGAPLEFSGSGYPGGKAFNRAAFVAPPA